MPLLRQVSLKSSTSKALNSQSHSSIYPYGFPFTLNPTMGCFFCCKFCYSPISVRKIIKGKRGSFFEEVTVRLGVPAKLDKELTRLSSLPQHLKRVQINEHSDYYLSDVMSELKKQNQPDILLEILNIFQKHWNNGNRWMLHILTKSHLILRHLNQLTLMRDMIQIEMSFSTPYESQLRDLEFFTPSIKKRLETIETLSKAGIFVRIMAMPFDGGPADLDKLKVDTFNAGAQAMKNKALNYFTWNNVKKTSYNNLVQNILPQTGSRKDTIISRAHTIKSGEAYLTNGSTQTINVLMPNNEAWDAMSKFQNRVSIQTLNVVDMGYSKLNTVNWSYIK